MKEPGLPTPKTPETAEKIHTEQEIVALMHIPGVGSVEEISEKDIRRKNDEQGLYFLEIQTPGTNPGDIDEYVYIRAGDHGNQNSEEVSHVYIVHYVDGIPQSSTQVAKFDSVSGEWKQIR